MAIAHGTTAFGAVNTVAGNYDTSITPGATPNGVCVLIHQNASIADLVTSVVYGTGAGSVTLTRRRFDTEATEAGGVYIYWVGDSAIFPSGLQTVRIVRTGTQNMRAVIYTMTCATGQQVALDIDDTATAATANPTLTLTTTQPTTQCYEVIHHATNTMTTTPAANWTLDPTQATADVDLGSQGRGFARRSFTTGPGDAAPGWTIAAAAWRLSAIAFKEAAPPAAPGRAPRRRQPRRRAGRAGRAIFT